MPKLIAIFLVTGVLTGCVMEPIIPGTYEINRSDQPESKISPWVTLVVSSSGIDISDLNPEVKYWTDGLEENHEPTVCVIENTASTDKFDPDETSVYFRVPERDGNFWKIRLLETHHYWSWLSLKTKNGSLVGSVSQSGWGGNGLAKLTVRKRGVPNSKLCKNAATALIPEKYASESPNK